MFKLLTSRNVFSGIGKRFNGIWSKDLCQTMEKAITEKMEKIVQLQDKENKQLKMDEFKSEMDELRAFLTSHQQIEKEFNEKLKKMIEDQLQQQTTTKASVPMPDNKKMALDQQAIIVRNPKWNRWDKILIQPEEDDYVYTDEWKWHNVFALNGFPISHEHYGNGMDLSSAGKTIYYYEVLVSKWYYRYVMVGLSGGFTDFLFGDYHANFYSVSDGCDHCCLSGTKHEFELPNGTIKPEWKSSERDIIGCGILVESSGKLLIFFTLNGNLMSKPIPITPSVDRLYPTVRIMCAALEANFGNDQAYPFKFNIANCAELGLE